MQKIARIAEISTKDTGEGYFLCSPCTRIKTFTTRFARLDVHLTCTSLIERLIQGASTDT